ncbi:hypothetical protein Tco_1439881 [Tanacetum coccineum]
MSALLPLSNTQQKSFKAATGLFCTLYLMYLVQERNFRTIFPATLFFNELIAEVKGLQLLEFPYRINHLGNSALAVSTAYTSLSKRAKQILPDFELFSESKVFQVDESVSHFFSIFYFPRQAVFQQAVGFVFNWEEFPHLPVQLVSKLKMNYPIPPD